MRKRVSYIFIFLISSALNGFTVSEKNPNQLEIEYFRGKEYKGDKEIYTEVDLYPPYFKESEASTEDIIRYLRLLRNEIFARHGYVFKSEIREFFEKMDWYKEKSTYLVISNIERENVNLIQKKENLLKQTGEEEKTKQEQGLIKEFSIGKLGYGPDDLGYRMWEGSPDYPVSVVSDSKGNIYVLDHLNNRIRVYSIDGEHIRDIKVHVYEPPTLKEMEESGGMPVGPKLYGNNMYIKADTIYVPVRRGFSPVSDIAKVLMIYKDKNWIVEDVKAEIVDEKLINSKSSEKDEIKVRLDSFNKALILNKNTKKELEIKFKEVMNKVFADKSGFIYFTNWGVYGLEVGGKPEVYSLVLKYSKEGDEIRRWKIPFSVCNPFVTKDGEVVAMTRIPKIKRYAAESVLSGEEIKIEIRR